jgi:hypothetical protein
MMLMTPGKIIFFNLISRKKKDRFFSLGYFKYQEVGIKLIQPLKILSLGYIKNSKKTILMLLNIVYFVNLMICHMVKCIFSSVIYRDDKFKEKFFRLLFLHYLYTTQILSLKIRTSVYSITYVIYYCLFRSGGLGA